MAADNQLGVAIRPDQHESRGVTLPRQIRDQIERRVVAPVKVFEDEYEGKISGQHLQRLAHFSQHALPRSAKQHALQALPIRGAYQRRHLQKPHRSVGAEYINDLVVLPAEPTDRLKHRHIRFAGSVLLQTLSARDGNALIGSQPPGEHIYKSSLSDPGLSGHKNDLTFSGPHLIEPGLH